MMAMCVIANAEIRAEVPAATEKQEAAPQAATVRAVDSYFSVVEPGQILAFVGYGNQLGVEVAPVEAPLRSHLNLQEGRGVVVTSTADESAAAKAGLKPYDVVLRIDDQEIASQERFHELAGGQQGKKVVFHILRNGKPQELGVTIPKTPVYQFANQLIVYDDFARDNQYRIGVTLASADDVLRSQLRLADGEGLVITDVVADGPAAKAGLHRNDVLVKLDDKRLSTVEAFNTLVQEIKDRPVTATIFRAGQEMSLALTPQLSTTNEIRNNPYLSTLVFNVDLAGNQPTARLNLNTLQSDWFRDYQPNVQWLGRSGALQVDIPALNQPTQPADASTAPAAKQLATLKRQLDEMRKSLASLEATLQSVKSEEKSDQPPKPQSEQSDKAQP
jgi:membrane-associated protease RseP (regulator of RpoE activity)